MKHCCEDKASELEALHRSQGNVLKIVFGINALMFILEFSGGLLSRSTALLGDSLDMFGDATVYAFSLYVLHRSQRWRASAALLKGILMVAFGAIVLIEAILKVSQDVLPVAKGMGGFGALALVANSICLFLLFRHKDDDINMRSTWICSRNDIIANVSVILGAGVVSLTSSKWPDILIGGAIAGLFLASAFSVLRDAGVALRTAEQSRGDSVSLH